MRLSIVGQDTLARPLKLPVSDTFQCLLEGKIAGRFIECSSYHTRDEDATISSPIDMSPSPSPFATSATRNDHPTPSNGKAGAMSTVASIALFLVLDPIWNVDPGLRDTAPSLD
ncbi:hypothetical protein HJFPF1_11448 [Paramyrothecium foliicola]|nr:hypothetical protein HJFPF1_11448 [Paramyrothecium foliicola]